MAGWAMKWRRNLGLVSGLMLCAVGLVYLWAGPTKAGDGAAWVQAVGSVGAIVFAVWQAKAASLDHDRANLDAAKFVSERFHLELSYIEAACDANDSLSLRMRAVALAEALAMMRQVRIENLPDREGVAYVALRADAAYIVANVDRAVKEPVNLMALCLTIVRPGLARFAESLPTLNARLPPKN